MMTYLRERGTGILRNSSKPVIFYINPNTGLTVIATPAGQFITGFKPNAEQINDLLTKQFLW